MVEVGKKQGGRRLGCAIAVAIFFGIGAVGSIISNMLGSAPESALDKAETERANADAATLGFSQQTIRRAMKDPSSAEFSGGFGRVKHGSRVACGRVNGKNSFGAFSGTAPWLVIIDQDVAMIKEFDNARRFVTLWNKYCTGLDDRDKPFPRKVFGIALGSRPPSSLKPYDADRNVWVYRANAPKDYLSVPITDVSFSAENGRLFGVQINSRSPGAYEEWRDAIRKDYGAASFDGATDRSILSWSWGKAHPKIQLSHNDNTSQTSLGITVH